MVDECADYAQLVACSEVYLSGCTLNCHLAFDVWLDRQPADCVHQRTVLAVCLTLLKILEIYWNYVFLLEILEIYWKFTKSPGKFLV